MSLVTDLSGLFGAAFADLGLDPALGAVAPSQRPELGQYQCNGALAGAKEAGRNPREIAQDIVNRVETDPRVRDLSIAGPGFVNVSVTDDHLTATLTSTTSDSRLGIHQHEPDRVIIDYGGANIAKSLHVGHLRTAAIGESIKRILRAQGHDVLGDVHLGDWGLPMGQLITEVEIRMPDLPYFDPAYEGPYPEESPVTMADLEEMYPAAAARCANDEAEAQKARLATADLQAGRPGYQALFDHFRSVSVAALKATYDRLDVEFDLWHGEMSINDRIAPMIERLESAGVVEHSQGARIIDVSQPDDRQDFPPLMLVNSRGAVMYHTTDLATIDERVNVMHRTVLLYFVDARQTLHFQQVFRAARKGGITGPEIVLEHAPNGTVNGPDGKPLKTRSGGLVPLESLLDEAHAKAAERLSENDIATDYSDTERDEIAERVAIAAVKFGELQNHRTSDYNLDLDRFTQFTGKTGPYLLYAVVRVGSLLRRAAEQGLATGALIEPRVDVERDLMLQLTRLPDVVDRAADLRAPNHIAEYAYEVAADLSRFYEQCHVLTEDDPARQASWLTLVDLTGAVLEVCLDLLAIPVPERM